MTPLARRLARLIGETGPIGVADYFAACLFDPEHGYYTTREPFGRGGDFVTAPEISQMFGELAGLWVYTAWDTAGRPERPLLAEIGPGRGTMMKDMQRALASLQGGGDFRFAMVETSPRLAAVQKKTLADADTRTAWHRDVDDLPPGSLFIVGNEIFDALPVRQFVRIEGNWRERAVGLDAGGGLAFVAGTGAADAALLPRGSGDKPDGAVFEYAPAREALMQRIAERIAADGGAGLFFDYGHLAPGFGDTLQALATHRAVGVLERPGESDLTSHVDFAALAGAARQAGLATRTTTQGDFLLAMGLLERAGALGADADAATRERLTAAAERLAAPQGMGTLFKAIGVAPADTALPGFAGAD